MPKPLNVPRPTWANRAPRTGDTPAKFWTIENNAGGTETDLYIYNEIGFWGVTAESFLSDIKGITSPTINLRVNSPGGDVFDGIAIMNTLRAHNSRIVVHVDGLAASIASVIAMAGDEIVMGAHSQMMIHDASGFCFGNAAEMEECGKLLNMISDNIAGVYAEKAGGDSATWRETMKAETWYTADEAVKAGLANRVAESKKKDEDVSDRLAAKWLNQLWPDKVGTKSDPATETKTEDETPPANIVVPENAFSGIADLFAPPPTPVFNIKDAVDLFLTNVPEPDTEVRDERNIPERNALAAALNPAAIADAIRGRI